MISLDPNWHDCDVLGHLFITSQFNWPRALHLWFVWSHVVLIGSCHFKSNLQSPHVWPFIRWCSPTTRLFFKAHATLRQYDVTSFYKTEGCFQALARRTGMGGNAWKCIRTCGYIQLYIYIHIHIYIYIHTHSSFWANFFFSRFPPHLCSYVSFSEVCFSLSNLFHPVFQPSNFNVRFHGFSVGRISSIRSLWWWSVWMLFGSLGSTQWSWLQAGGLYHWTVFVFSLRLIYILYICIHK